jgi:hypothetical protein
MGLNVAAVTGLLLSGACGAPDRDTMRVFETIELPDSGAWTLHAGHDSIIWVGFPGEILGVDQSGKQLVRHAPGGAGVPIVRGRSDDRLFFRTRDSISSVSPAAAIMTRPGRSSGDLLVDPLGRFLLGTEENGGIIALDADTLDPVWGWAALGATSTAIAMTRSGHRVYQAVDRSGDADSPQLLVRDAQTGRVLRSVRVPIAAASIVVGDADEAYLAGRSETGGTSVVSLVWRGGEMEVAWRRVLE